MDTYEPHWNSAQYLSPVCLQNHPLDPISSISECPSMDPTCQRMFQACLRALMGLPPCGGKPKMSPIAGISFAPWTPIPLLTCSLPLRSESAFVNTRRTYVTPW